MKKLLSLLMLSTFLFLSVPAIADEIEDDYFDIASNYCVTGDYDKAMEFLDKILKANPDSKQAKYLKSGLTHVIAQDKITFVTSVNQYVKEAHENKRYGDESNEYASLLKGSEGKNSYLAFYYLGNFYRDRYQYSKAIDAYNQSISARVDFSSAYLALAVTSFEAGHYQSVINSVDKYLTFIPDDDFAYALKSRAEFQLGQIEAARADNDKALLINDCPEYRFDKAKILYKEGNYTDSKNLFKDLLSDIQSSKIYEYMGLCDIACANYLSALENINRAYILSDNDSYLENKYNEIKKILEGENNE